MIKQAISVLAASCLMLLAACAPSSTQPTAPAPSTNQPAGSGSGSTGEVITLTLWDYWSTDAQLKALDEMFAAYQKVRPNVKIERTYVPFNDLKNKLLMGATAGQLPDLVAIGNPDLQSFAAAGALADISAEIKEWGQTDKYFEGPWSSTMYQGKNYGVPVGSNNLALYYNEDMLKAAGVEPPKNWEELKQAAQKVAKPGVYGLVAAGIKSEEGAFQFLPFIWQAGSDLNTFDSQGTVDAITLWKELVDSGAMSKEIINLNQQDVAVQFSAGKAAMMVNGPWQIPFLQKEGKVKWGVVPLPSNKQGGTILGGEDWAITSTSKNKEMAWDFLKFTQEPENILAFAKAMGYVPSRKDLIQDSYWQNDPILKAFADGMEFAKARAYGPEYPKASVAMQEMMQQVITGAKSPQDAVKEADAKIKPLIP
ncbi:sugar ABC transporter substrate-binding protein [Brevibacillus migulae]|uniref:sugar ABC transporter substrate-binding protein n=1 Tax=Brevibacillus migulae TaxID=1644114 RepID=UPI00106EFC79|nr:sugar ABC transporter substrate-binding protein [Brevibacillus migulae]